MADSIIISTYFCESTKGRAEVRQTSSGYCIDFYNFNGDLIVSESFLGKSLRYVEDAAENWALGIKQLNG